MALSCQDHPSRPGSVCRHNPGEIDPCRQFPAVVIPSVPLRREGTGRQLALHQLPHECSGRVENLQGDRRCRGQAEQDRDFPRAWVRGQSENQRLRNLGCPLNSGRRTLTAQAERSFSLVVVGRLTPVLGCERACAVYVAASSRLRTRIRRTGRPLPVPDVGSDALKGRRDCAGPRRGVAARALRLGTWIRRTLRPLSVPDVGSGTLRWRCDGARSGRRVTACALRLWTRIRRTRRPLSVPDVRSDTLRWSCDCAGSGRRVTACALRLGTRIRRTRRPLPVPDVWRRALW